MWASFDVLSEIMAQLGLTISDKKLVFSTMQVTCLCVMIDTVQGILPDKLHDITNMVCKWLTKDITTKCQMQSILGLLLYVHKHVKTAHVF